MTAPPDNPFQPMMDAWVSAQSEFLKTVGESKGAADPTDPFAQLQQQATAWLRAGMSGETNEAQKVLHRMLDPTQFFRADGGDLSQTWTRLYEAPGLADIATIEAKVLHATSEWVTFQSAMNEFRVVLGKAWSRAFEKFKVDIGHDPEIWQAGLETTMNQWLDMLNSELEKTQRSDAFLEAQKRVIRAGAAYKTREREIVEAWCDAHSVPTRTEVDALHETITELKRELRALKKGDRG